MLPEQVVHFLSMIPPDCTNVNVNVQSPLEVVFVVFPVRLYS